MQLVTTAGLVPTSARSLGATRLYVPKSLAEALDALREADNPVLLAGGTDLVAAFNEGLAPGELVNLSQLQELRTIRATPGGISIGATVTHHAGCTDPLVRERAAGFAQGWSRISNPRIRFTATLGGNLMARRVRYEGSILLTAAHARLEFATANGPLQLAPADVWDGRVPARALLVAIGIDTADLLWYAYERSMRPLITLAACLRRNASGVTLTCAVATECLRPAQLEVNLPARDLVAVATSAREIASDAFAQLPSTFADPVVTHSYAKAAGSALLARQLAGAVHG
jgi:carbon-monoxide dehydrogenase medium subunit